MVVFHHVIKHHLKTSSSTHEKNLTTSFFRNLKAKKKIMSLTRRSFIKKSSYSAAAVTAFGTGVGLSQNVTSCQNMEVPSMTMSLAQNQNDFNEESEYKYLTKNQEIGAGWIRFYEVMQNAIFVLDPKICVDGMKQVLEITPPAGTPGAGITVPVVTATKHPTTNKWRYELKIPRTAGDYKVTFWRLPHADGS